MNKPLAYIIDLDGTLYDNSHRQHLIPADRSNTAGWVAFNSACAEDGLREDMADLVRSILLSGREVIFLTGRGEAAREPTMQRLLKDFNFIEQPTLIMRPMDSHTSASEFKRDAVERIWFSKRWAPYCLIALEDDPSVVEVMRSMGVTVLQIDSKCCALQTAEVDTAPAQFESLTGEPVSQRYKLNVPEIPERSISAAQFVKDYCAAGGISEAEFYETQVPMPDRSSPSGWAAVTNSPLHIKAHVELYVSVPQQEVKS